MNRLVILSVAAGALVPASALAQHHATPRPGVSWHAPAPHSGAPVRRPLDVRRAPHAAPMPHVQHHVRDRVEARGRDHVIARHLGDRLVRRHHAINGYPHYRRFDRGIVLPHHWWGPSFHIQNWGMYGLPQPMHGGRWVRYYDDALMIDHTGRVLDGRWGMAWDEWDDQWDYDDRGVPVYVGNGDYVPGEEDYAWAEGGERYADGPPPPPCAQSCGYGPMPHAYPGYAYGGGYMWIPGGMITVTETTVTTEPQVVHETVYVEKPHRAHKPRRVYRPKTKIIHR